MKLASFRPLGHHPDAPRIGVVVDDWVLDLTRSAALCLGQEGTEDRSRELARAIIGADLVAFLEAGPLALGLARDAIELAGEPAPGPLWWRCADVEMRAPLRPRMLREFSAFESHLTAGGHSLPDIYYKLPIYWKGNTASVIGPEQEIPFPAYTDMLDFELEIAVVIGRAGRSVTPAEAEKMIAGFTIMNDVSARDIQMAEMSAFLGPAKAKDFCNVLGPVLVTPDEIDPNELAVRVVLNDEVVAESTSRGMYYSWGEMIAHASQDEWLLPGDVMSGGTVVGCSGVEVRGFPERGPILEPGDVIEFEVEGIGVLRNVVGRPTGVRVPSIDYPGYGTLPKTFPWENRGITITEEPA